MGAYGMRIACILVLMLLVWTNAVVANTEAAADDPWRELWARIDGSTATLPMSEAILMHRLDIDAREAAGRIAHNKTYTAYRQLLAGRADLIFVPEPEPGELDRAWADILEWGETEAGAQRPELTYIPVVREGLVFLTNAANPVEGLTSDQLRGIYAGDIVNWREVGGADTAIMPFQRNSDSGSQTAFLQLLMGDTEPMPPEATLTHSSMGYLVEAIAGYDNRESALGYSMYYYVTQMYGKESLRLLAVDGVSPTRESIADGSYPLTTYYYAVMRQDLPADHPARQLTDWLLTPEGQQVMADAGYVPMGAGE